MRALCWHGTSDVRYDTVPDPKIEDPRDAIVRVTACAICGSDLHLYDGYMPSMKLGDVLGHETMGEVVEVGSGNDSLKVGDRVVVPFNIACGECFFCGKGLFSLCDRSNPNSDKAARIMGHSPAGLFGYSHLLGGYPGGQAEYLRVPYADIGHVKVPERMEMAESHGRAETIDFTSDDVYERLMEMTGGRGPDRCIDAVGAEAHGRGSPDATWDRIKAGAYLATDRPRVLRETIMCCRKGGTISVPGVYIGFVDMLPFGAFMNKALTFRTGQTHTHRYLEPLLGRIQSGEIDPSFVITHTASLEEGPELYRTFRDKEDGCIKVVLQP